MRPKAMTERQRRACARELAELFGKDTLQRMAFKTFVELADTRKRYAANIATAFHQYGERGPLVSGAIRDHFPEFVKIELRHDARHITELIDRSWDYWRASGRRYATWHTALSAVPRHGSRY